MLKFDSDDDSEMRQRRVAGIDFIYSPEEMAVEDEYDSENPDPYANDEDDEDMGVEEAEDIRERRPKKDSFGEWGVPDYADLTEGDYADKMSEENFIEFVSLQFKKYLAEHKSDHIPELKKFLTTAQDKDIDLALGMDSSLIADCLTAAVERNNNNDAIAFFSSLKPNLNNAVTIAINKDDASLLEMLEPEVLADYVKHAAKNKKYAALAYFFEQDFVVAQKAALSVAIKNKQPAIVKKVIERLDLEAISEFVKFMTKNSAMHFLPLLFDKFEVDDIFDEVQAGESGRNFFYVLLDAAKNHLTEDKKFQLKLKDIENEFERLHLSENFLFYPLKAFAGHEVLGAIRKLIVEDPHNYEEVCVAASFIGIPFSTANRYHSNSPFHPSEPHLSERYVRSGRHPFSSHFGKHTYFASDASLPEAKAKPGSIKATHAGLYNNSMEAGNRFKKVAKEKMPKTKIAPQPMAKTNLYDANLWYRHTICQYIGRKIASKPTSHIKAGFYHNYPCVMVKINETPWKKLSVGTEEAWTELLISFVVALVNYHAHEKGLNIELIRRPSFGFLTPTVAPCGPSIRINVGIIPEIYADVLAQSLHELDAMLATLADADSLANLKAELPETCFIKSADFKRYYKKPQLPQVNNVIELLGTKVDQGGYTASYNLKRTASARDNLANHIYAALTTAKKGHAEIFVAALQWGVNLFQIKKDTLNYKQESVEAKTALTVEPTLKDNNFWEMITLIKEGTEKAFTKRLLIIEAAKNATYQRISAALKNTKLGNLYHDLELANELLFSQSLVTCNQTHIDDYGSDSETENLQQKLFSKKLIVKNGMRALLTALRAAGEFLDPNYLSGIKKPTLNLHGSYYETADALESFGKFKVMPRAHIANANIILADINPCRKEGSALKPLADAEVSKCKILILDTTSATITEQRNWLKRFQSKPQNQILILASSGFKNEQLGADKNPYGTVRVFAKKKSDREKFIELFRAKKEPNESAVSHHYRRVMKSIGMIPRNGVLVDFTQGTQVSSSSSSSSSSASATAASSSISTSASAPHMAFFPATAQIPATYATARNPAAKTVNQKNKKQQAKTVVVKGIVSKPKPAPKDDSDEEEKLRELSEMFGLK